MKLPRTANMHRRDYLTAMLAGAAVMTGCATTSARPKTYVLIHGAYHGRWAWDAVKPLLEKPGVRVLAPTLKGLAERQHENGPEVNLDTHIDEVIALLETEQLRDVVLVGHSYAGMVVTGVCDRRPERIAHVVYLDAVQYQWTDLVCTRGRLPFRDHTFDAVVSQAVFEHLEDPHQTARELYRILRPGGLIHLDTAFMQPLHGDPWHFFNMTQHGLRQVMAPFQEIRCGIKSYQYPSASLLMQLEAITPFITSRKWRKTITKWHKELQAGAGEFDDSLGEFGRTTLAAGFYFEGRRP